MQTKFIETFLAASGKGMLNFLSLLRLALVNFQLFSLRSYELFMRQGLVILHTFCVKFSCAFTGS